MYNWAELFTLGHVSSSMDLMKFIKQFDTEEKCIAYLVAKRWPHGPVCDKCGTVGHAFKLGDLRK